MPEIIFAIPEDRIKVFIGKKGQTKRMLEKTLGVKIKVNTKENTLSINVQDPVMEAKIKDIVDAISHGFNPDIALNLLDENYILYRINMRELYGKKKNTIRRYKSRVIGIGGTIKRKIEEYTGTHISIYDDYIYIIGRIEDVITAKEGIEKILQGSKHSTVIAYLEQKSIEKNLMLR